MSNTIPIPLPEPVTLYHRPSFLAGEYIYITGHTPDQMREYAAAVSAADNAALREHLGNLLAVLHGDGGHYEAEHGTDKAVADALTRFYSNIMAADSKITAQGERIKVLEDALRFYLEVYENVPDAIDRYGDWYQTDEAKLADTGARAALGEKNG